MSIRPPCVTTRARRATRRTLDGRTKPRTVMLSPNTLNAKTLSMLPPPNSQPILSGGARSGLSTCDMLEPGTVRPTIRPSLAAAGLPRRSMLLPLPALQCATFGAVTQIHEGSHQLHQWRTMSRCHKCPAQGHHRKTGTRACERQTASHATAMGRRPAECLG